MATGGKGQLYPLCLSDWSPLVCVIIDSYTFDNESLLLQKMLAN